MQGLRLISVVLLWLTTLPLQRVDAAPLTPVTSCTIDDLPVSCGNLASTAGTALFYNNGLGTTLLELTVVSIVSATLPAGNPPASAAIDLTFYATTAGPVRPGIAAFAVAASGDGSFVGLKNRNSSASIDALPGCTLEFPFCLVDSELPFTLGVPFQIKLTADVEVDTGGEPGGFTTDASIRLALFELVDGVRVPVTIQGPVVVPEPNQFVPALLFVGAGILWKLQIHKLRRD